MLSPLYISEVAPANIRGRLTTVQQVMIITGLTAAFLVNYFLAQSAGNSLGEVGGLPAWRWMYLAQAVPAVVFLVAVIKGRLGVDQSPMGAGGAGIEGARRKSGR